MSRRPLIVAVLVALALGGSWLAGCESDTRETEREGEPEKVAEPSAAVEIPEEAQPAQAPPSRLVAEMTEETEPEATAPAEAAPEAPAVAKAEATQKIRHAHLASAKIPGKWVGRDEVPGEITAYKFRALEEIEGKVGEHSQEKVSGNVLETTVEFTGAEGAQGQARILVTIEYKE